MLRTLAASFLLGSLLFGGVAFGATTEAQWLKSHAAGWVAPPDRPWERGAHRFQNLSGYLSASTSARAATFQSGDEYWWNGFDLPEVNGDVICAVEYEGKLVIGGSFSRIGDVDASNVACWDGAKWAPFGGGTDLRVDAIFVFEGDLVIGGQFSHAGGIPAQGVARWNGSKWAAYGPGLGFLDYYGYGTGGPRAFTTYKGQLVAGGDFTRTGNFPVQYLARWNGTAWLPLIYGIDGPVHALATLEDTLYLGGRFQTAGYVHTVGVAKWNGDLCSPLGLGLKTETPYGYDPTDVNQLVPWNGKIVAGGYFEEADSIEVDGLAAWNGSSWEPLGDNPFGAYPSTVALDGEDLIAGVYGSVMKWDGATWSEYAPGLWGQPSCLTRYGSDLFSGGHISVVDPIDGSFQASSLALHTLGGWTGLIPWTDHMRGLGGPYPAYVLGLEPYRDQLVVMGQFLMSGDPPHWKETSSLAGWNGTSWSQFPLPGPYSWSGRTLLANSDSLYIGGRFVDYSDSTHVLHPVARFDGTAWAVLDTLSLDLSSMAIYRGELYIAGERTLPDRHRGEVHRWTGSRWELVGFTVGTAYQALETMVVHDGKLIVGGSFEGISNVPAASIATWDGSQWASLGSEVFSYYLPRIHTLVEHRGALVASGEFPYQSGVAQWNGTTWIPLGQVLAYASTLASIGNELYLGGAIRFLDGRTVRDEWIARWDGRSWESLGSGIDQWVTSLKGWHGSLYAGGFFTRAGTHGSYGVARWDGVRSVLNAPRITLAPGVPNPFRASSVFRYELAATGRVRISVHDVRGREIRVIEENEHAAGDHTVSWDGRARDGRPAASGIYYVRVQLPNGIEKSQKTVLLR